MNLRGIKWCIEKDAVQATLTRDEARRIAANSAGCSEITPFRLPHFRPLCQLWPAADITPLGLPPLCANRRRSVGRRFVSSGHAWPREGRSGGQVSAINLATSAA